MFKRIEYDTFNLTLVYPKILEAKSFSFATFSHKITTQCTNKSGPVFKIIQVSKQD